MYKTVTRAFCTVLATVTAIALAALFIGAVILAQYHFSKPEHRGYMDGAVAGVFAVFILELGVRFGRYLVKTWGEVRQGIEVHTRNLLGRILGFPGVFRGHYAFFRRRSHFSRRASAKLAWSLTWLMLYGARVEMSVQ